MSVAGPPKEGARTVPDPPKEGAPTVPDPPKEGAPSVPDPVPDPPKEGAPSVPDPVPDPPKEGAPSVPDPVPDPPKEGAPSVPDPVPDPPKEGAPSVPDPVPDPPKEGAPSVPDPVPDPPKDPEDAPVSVRLDRGSNSSFNFKLPKEGLALRSAAVVDGVPEFGFEASPKVPTLTEEDVATAFRLVAEGKRPGFFYTGFPITHPLHHSRLFMQYSPAWLRGTGVGELLADADWSMKCMHVGTRTNKDKSVFKSWSEGSELHGLATHLDFPKDGRGPTMMSCEYARIEKGESEIVFPEEPKMKITDHCSSKYSEYITQHYPSVAYYDEPKFLKMQELIKLVLAVEWLYKEKGVRVSEEWVMKHTSRRGVKKSANLKSKRPPRRMIPPLPSKFERPCSDVTVKTWEAETNSTLRTEYGVEKRYGYYDFGGAEVRLFKEDGTPCPPVKCLKLGVCVDCFGIGSDVADFEARLWFYLPKVLEPSECRDKLLKLLPKIPHNEITMLPVPAFVHAEIEDRSNKSGMEVRVTESFHPLPPLAIPARKTVVVMTATVDNYNMLYAKEDPNTPIQPEIPGFCEEIVPGVQSWDELISEMSVPIPRVWQLPYIGVGEPTARGGVTAQEFRVREEPLRRREVRQETEWKDSFKRREQMLVVRAQHNPGQVSIQLLHFGYDKFTAVSAKFSSEWKKGACPSVKLIFEITNATLKKKFVAYRSSRQQKDVEQHFHGTTLACNITTTRDICTKGACGICGISSEGLNPDCIRKDKDDFQRFGSGFYLAPNSSKCHDYTDCTPETLGDRAMLLCDVCPGRKYEIKRNSPNLTRPPPGFDSVYGQVGAKLNYPELVVYDQRAVMPRYIVVYSL